MDLDMIQELASESVCTRCRGRIFASLGHEMTNGERGKALNFSLEALGFKVNITSEENCEICHGMFLELGVYAEEIGRRLESYEFKTFLIGTTVSRDIIEKEKRIHLKYGDHGESIKKELNRELGKILSSKIKKEFERSDPDIMVKINTEFMTIDLQIKSIYIYGTYRKLRRDLPQTRWIKYSEIKETVESIIGEPAMAMARGKNYFLHGAGREDVDVRMLGNGREFIIEVANPEIRSIDLNELKNAVNSSGQGIEIENLKFATKSEVSKIKDEKYNKKYRALIVREDGKPIDMENLEKALNYLNGKVIYQRTPLRVSASRSDLVRERRILNIFLESKEPPTLIIEAEAGTYIKELVSGDNGRTNPSVSELSGQRLKIGELDVIEIER